MYQLVDDLMTSIRCPLAWSSSSMYFMLIQWLPSTGNTRILPASQGDVSSKETRHTARNVNIPHAGVGMVPKKSEKIGGNTVVINYH